MAALFWTWIAYAIFSIIK